MIGTIKQQAKDLLAELSRVDWPSKDKVISSTWSILVLSIFVGFFLFFADWCISHSLHFMFPNR